MTSNDNHEHNPSKGYSDEVDLIKLFSVIWKGKWIIITVTFLFALSSVCLALYLPNEYKASAVVQPNDSGGGKMASLAGQFGGLASLAGINLGAGESSDAVIAMEVIQSWGFAESFIKKHNLSVPLFAAKKWSEKNNSLILDDNLYDAKSSTWLREAPKGKTTEPTSWELYKIYKERVDISQDKETGLVSISVTFFSPIMAKQLADWLVEDINLFMKERALKEANESIQYLEEQIRQTSIAEIRTAFSELIQEQHKTKMLAQVSDEYVFKTISEVKIPEEKAKPRRVMICIVGFILGLILSIAFVLVRSYINKSLD